jgi:hypothetical protein
MKCPSGGNCDGDLLFLLSDKMHCGEYTHLVLFTQLMCISFNIEAVSTFMNDAFLFTGTKRELGQSDVNTC